MIIFAAILSALLIWFSSAESINQHFEKFIASRKAEFFIQSLNDSINEVNLLRGKNLRRVEKIDGGRLVNNENGLFLSYCNSLYPIRGNVVILPSNKTFYEIYYNNEIIVTG